MATLSPGKQLQAKLSPTFNQTNLAAACNVSTQAVSAWCCDLARPSPKNQKIIQRKLGLSVDVFAAKPKKIASSHRTTMTRRTPRRAAKRA